MPAFSTRLSGATAPVRLSSARPTTRVPVVSALLWTPLRAYIEELTGAASARLPALDSLPGFALEADS